MYNYKTYYIIHIKLTSAQLKYIPKICVILGAITTNFFRFFKDGVFSKNEFV